MASEQQYTIVPGGSAASVVVALVGATAKTVLSIRASAVARPVRIVEIGIGFDGVTGTNAPVLVELCRWTGAGTGTSTAVTPQQVGGPPGAAQSVGAYNYTAEPTALAVLKDWLVTPAGGELVVQFPLDREPVCETGLAQAAGLALRCNAPNAVNCRPYLEFTE